MIVFSISYVFHSLSPGPGEHPIKDALYVDSDYNTHTIPDFDPDNHTGWTFKGDTPRTDSPESLMDVTEALKRASYMKAAVNKTKEYRKFMEEYKRGFNDDKNYFIHRKKRDIQAKVGNVQSGHRQRQDVNEGVRDTRDVGRRMKRIDNTFDKVVNRDENRNVEHVKYRREIGDENKLDIENIDEFMNGGKTTIKTDKQETVVQETTISREHVMDEEFLARALHEKGLKRTSQDNQDGKQGPDVKDTNGEILKPNEKEEQVQKEDRSQETTTGHQETDNKREKETAEDSDEFISIQANLGKKNRRPTRKRFNLKEVARKNKLNRVPPKPEPYTLPATWYFTENTTTPGEGEIYTINAHDFAPIMF